MKRNILWGAAVGGITTVAICGIISLVAAFALFDALVIRDVWNWIAAPTLGFSPIKFWEAFGLNLVVQSFSMKPEPQVQVKAWFDYYFKFILSVLFLWGLAYLVAHYKLGTV